MSFFEFPFTRTYSGDLGWLIRKLKEVEDIALTKSLKYADPIQWNITSQYELNTIVIDPISGVAYMSVQAVPSGISISNTDYWTPVFDLGRFVTKMAQNLANIVEPETTLTATVASSYNDWIIWGDVLYRNINPSGILVGDAYVIGSNIEPFTIENIIGHIQDLSTNDKSNLVAAINEVLQTLLNTAGNLNDLQTTDKTNLVAAINSLLITLSALIGNIGDAITPPDTRTSIINVINYVYNKLGVGDLNTTAQNAVDAIDELLVRIGITPLDTAAQNLSDAVNELFNRPNTINTLVGKKVAFYGDSLTIGLLQDATFATDTYPKVFGDLTGATVYNNAINGQSLCTYDANSFSTLVGTLDFTDYDYVVIALGTNDVGHGVPLYGNDNSSFYYALEYSIQTILANNPKCHIVLCSPFYGRGLNYRYSPSNICLMDIYYAVKSTATKYSLPFVDFVYGPGINTENDDILQWDGLHFTEDGYRVLGEYIARNFIEVSTKMRKQVLYQAIDTTQETSGYRVTFESVNPMDSCMILSWAEGFTGFCISFTACNPLVSLNMIVPGTTGIPSLGAGAITLYPDAASAVSMTPDEFTPTRMSGEVYWYSGGNLGKVHIMVISLS